MKKYDKSILIGLILGDGYIYKYFDKRWESFSYSVKIKHCIKQKKYLEYKALKLNSILGGAQNKVIEINNNGYPGCQYSKGSKHLKSIYNLLYKDKKKKIRRQVLNHLNAEGIAFWYMDDGSVYPQKKNGKIHAYQLVISTCCDTEDEANEIIDYFQETWNVQFRIKRNKGKYSITCNTREIRKFMPIVKPYVEKIDCMKYKIVDI
ncbi:MAG: hypothetical protein K5655_04475 [Lachnospiraceae bacterium]|nr:hypothetical protein [Lachnospiraceae bacterium]